MLKKLFTLCFVSLLFMLNALAYSEDNISALEYSKYGINYPYESLGERLNRLETDYFGMSQSGDIDSRIANLSKINANRKNVITPNYYENYYNSKPKSGIRNFWNNITSGLSNNGYVTGYTPSMNYSTGSGYSGSMFQNSPYGNNIQSFCPYDTGFHNRSPIHPSQYYNNKYSKPSYNGFNGINRFVKNPNTGINPRKYPYRNYHNKPYNHGYYPNKSPYTNRTTFYTPPDIQTKSSIHILKD